MNSIQLGWVDFSKEQRKKVLSVIDLLTEPGAVDELGIGVVRDAFANIFFPGTSTIQTRAKYFLIVPYLFYELEREKRLNPETMIKLLHERELDLIDILKQDGAWGIIGENAGRELKRKPSDVYWNGLRTYGIFTNEKLTLNEYVRVYHTLKNKKEDVKTHFSDSDEDDRSNVSLQESSKGFWKMPSFHQDWRETLTIELTKTEAKFLKEQITSSIPDSLFAWILKNDKTEILTLKSFEQLDKIFDQLPTPIQKDYQMAIAFANFIYGAHIRYNVILSLGKDKALNEQWDKWHRNIKTHANLGIEEIIDRLNIRNSSKLRRFLVQLQMTMLNNDISSLDEIIIKREKDLKGEKRSKLHNRTEYSYKDWVGISKLQYRFGNAKNILNDIYDALEGGD